MKIVIIGGTGLIGRKLHALLDRAGHAVVAASPSSGVDTVSGRGLPEALAGADVVVDVCNSPSFESDAVMRFFQASTLNLVRAAAEAGVRHLVALSIVGVDRLPDSGYFLAKLAQEEILRAAGLPHTVVRATQFFEFLSAIAESGADGERVRLTGARLQPIASDDVAAALAEVVTQPPRNGFLEIAGPDALPLDELARRVLRARGDARQVIRDEAATYFGARIDDRSLTPGEGARIGKISLQAWLSAA